MLLASPVGWQRLRMIVRFPGLPGVLQIVFQKIRAVGFVAQFRKHRRYFAAVVCRVIRAVRDDLPARQGIRLPAQVRPLDHQGQFVVIQAEQVGAAFIL